MGWVVNDTPRPLYPRERPGTHCTGGWVELRARSGRVRKISSLPGFDPRTVQPVSSSYTDCAIPAHYGDRVSTYLSVYVYMCVCMYIFMYVQHLCVCV
jgi:hypothetical protein